MSDDNTRTPKSYDDFRAELGTYMTVTRGLLDNLEHAQARDGRLEAGAVTAALVVAVSELEERVLDAEGRIDDTEGRLRELEN